METSSKAFNISQDAPLLGLILDLVSGVHMVHLDREKLKMERQQTNDAPTTSTSS